MSPLLPGRKYSTAKLGRDMEELVRALAGKQAEKGWQLKEKSFDWRKAGKTETLGGVTREQYNVSFQLENPDKNRTLKYSDLFHVYPEQGGAMSTVSHQFVVPDVMQRYGHREAVADWMVDQALGGQRKDDFHVEHLVPPGAVQRLKAIEEGKFAVPQGTSGFGRAESFHNVLSTVTLKSLDVDSERVVQEYLTQMPETLSRENFIGDENVRLVSSGAWLTGGGEGNPPTALLLSKFNLLHTMAGRGVEALFDDDGNLQLGAKSVHATRYGATDPNQDLIMRRLLSRSEKEAGASPYEGKVAPGRSAYLREGNLRSVTIGFGALLPGTGQTGMGGALIADWLADAIRPGQMRRRRHEVPPAEMRAEELKLQRTLGQRYDEGTSLAREGGVMLRSLPRNWEKIKKKSPATERDFEVVESFPGASAFAMTSAVYRMPIADNPQWGWDETLSLYKGRFGADLGLTGGKAYQMAHMERTEGAMRFGQGRKLVDRIEQAFRGNLSMEEMKGLYDEWAERERTTRAEAAEDVRLHGPKATHAWRGFAGDYVPLTFGHPGVRNKLATIETEYAAWGSGLGGTKLTDQFAHMKATGSYAMLDNLPEELRDVGLFFGGHEGVKQPAKAMALHFASTERGQQYLRARAKHLIPGANMGVFFQPFKGAKDPDLKGLYDIDYDHPDAISTLNAVTTHMMEMKPERRRKMLRGAGTLVEIPEMEQEVTLERARMLGLDIQHEKAQRGDEWRVKHGNAELLFRHVGDPYRLHMTARNAEVILGKLAPRARYGAPTTGKSSSFPIEETLEQTLPQAIASAEEYNLPFVKLLALGAKNVLTRKRAGAARDFESMFLMDDTSEELEMQGVDTIRLGAKELHGLYKRAVELTALHSPEGREPQSPPDKYQRMAYKEFFESRKAERSVIVAHRRGKEVTLPSWSAIERSSHTKALGAEGTPLGKMFNRLAEEGAEGSVISGAENVSRQARRLLHHDSQVSTVFHGIQVATRHTLQGAAGIPFGAHLDVSSEEDIRAAVEHLGWQADKWTKLSQSGDTTVYHNGLTVQYLWGGDNDGDILHAMLYRQETGRMLDEVDEEGNIKKVPETMSVGQSTRYPQTSGGQTSGTVGLADYFGKLPEKGRIQLQRYGMSMVLSNSMGEKFAKEFMENTRWASTTSELQSYMKKAENQLYDKDTGILGWLGARVGQGAMRQGVEWLLGQRETITADTMLEAWSPPKFLNDVAHAAVAATQAMSKRAIQFSYDPGASWPGQERSLPFFFADRQSQEKVERFRREWLRRQNVMSVAYQTYIDEDAQAKSVTDLFKAINEIKPGEKMMAQQAIGQFSGIDFDKEGEYERKDLAAALHKFIVSQDSLPKDPVAASMLLVTPDTDLGSFHEAYDRLSKSFLRELRDRKRWHRDSEGASTLFTTSKGQERLTDIISDFGRALHGKDFYLDEGNPEFLKLMPQTLGAFVMASHGRRRLQHGLERMDDEKFLKEYGVSKSAALHSTQEMMENLGETEESSVMERGFTAGIEMDIWRRTVGGRGKSPGAGLNTRTMMLGPRIARFARRKMATGRLRDMEEARRSVATLQRLSVGWDEDPNRDYMN